MVLDTGNLTPDFLHCEVIFEADGSVTLASLNLPGIVEGGRDTPEAVRNIMLALDLELHRLTSRWQPVEWLQRWEYMVDEDATTIRILL